MKNTVGAKLGEHENKYMSVLSQHIINKLLVLFKKILPSVTQYVHVAYAIGCRQHTCVYACKQAAAMLHVSFCKCLPRPALLLTTGSL